MRKSTKFIGALAVAGLVAAGGSAFTSIGLTNNAPSSVFVGGTVSQSVTGASLNSIVYTYAPDGSNTIINSFAATFAAGVADGHVVSTVVTGTSGAWSCTVITTLVSTCTNATPSAGATSVAITVV
jgi:hypothetical protein